MFGLKSLRRDIQRHASDVQRHQQELTASVSDLQDSVHEKLTSPVTIASSFGAGAVLGFFATRPQTEEDPVTVAEDVTVNIDKAEITGADHSGKSESRTKVLQLIKDMAIAVVVKEATVLVKEIAHEELQKLRQTDRKSTDNSPDNGEDELKTSESA